MPNIKKMKQTMLDQGIPRETIAQIASVVDKDKTPLENITAFIGQMDSLLSRGQCLAIMEEQGCHKTERVVAPFRAFGQAHADQPIEEKIGLLAEIDTIYGYRCRLNPDETLSVY